MALGSVFVELMKAPVWFKLMNSFHILAASGLALAVATVSASFRILPHSQEVRLPGLRARWGAAGGSPPGGAVGTFCPGFGRPVPGRQVPGWSPRRLSCGVGDAEGGENTFCCKRKGVKGFFRTVGLCLNTSRYFEGTLSPFYNLNSVLSVFNDLLFQYVHHHQELTWLNGRTNTEHSL